MIWWLVGLICSSRLCQKIPFKAIEPFSGNRKPKKNQLPKINIYHKLSALRPNSLVDAKYWLPKKAKSFIYFSCPVFSFVGHGKSFGERLWTEGLDWKEVHPRSGTRFSLEFLGHFLMVFHISLVSLMNHAHADMVWRSLLPALVTAVADDKVICPCGC